MVQEDEREEGVKRGKTRRMEARVRRREERRQKKEWKTV